MNDRESGDMDTDSVINKLQSQDQSGDDHSAGQLNIEDLRKKVLNAMKEISRLEKAVEEKNTQLAIAAKEKDRLIHALNKAFEEKKELHDKFADFDILRNMEISEHKEEIEKIISERKRLFKEKEDLIEDVFERDNAIEELRYAVERKENQLQEAQAAIERLKEIESRYKGVEANEKLVAEKDELNLKLAEADKEVILLKGKNSVYSDKIEELKEVITDLTIKIDEKINENRSLKKEMSALNLLLEEGEKEKDRVNSERINLEKTMQLKDREIEDLKGGYDSDIKRLTQEIEKLTSEKTELETSIKETKGKLERHENEYLDELSLKDEVISVLRQERDKEVSEYQAAIEKLTAERDELNLKITEAAKELASLSEEKVDKEIEGDKRLIYVEPPMVKEEKEEKEAGELLAEEDKVHSEPSVTGAGKMIYIMPSGLRGIKKIAMWIIILLILGLAWHVLSK